MLTYQKNEVNRAILTQLARLQHNYVNSPLLQSNIGKIMIFQCFKKCGNSQNNPFAFWKVSHFARRLELRAAHVRANVLRTWSADKIDRLNLIHLQKYHWIGKGPFRITLQKMAHFAFSVKNCIHYFRWTAVLIVVTNSFLTALKEKMR